MVTGLKDGLILLDGKPASLFVEVTTGKLKLTVANKDRVVEWVADINKAFPANSPHGKRLSLKVAETGRENQIISLAKKFAVMLQDFKHRISIIIEDLEVLVDES